MKFWDNSHSIWWWPQFIHFLYFRNSRLTIPWTRSTTRTVHLFVVQLENCLRISIVHQLAIISTQFNQSTGRYIVCLCFVFHWYCGSSFEIRVHASRKFTKNGTSLEMSMSIFSFNLRSQFKFFISQAINNQLTRPTFQRGQFEFRIHILPSSNHRACTQLNLTKDNSKSKSC